jgi:hypothetical protein
VAIAEIVGPLTTA